MKSCYLSCENIELRAGYTTLITSFSLKIQPQESFALIGANGSGKTSLLRALSGISRPHKGTVSVMGESIWPTTNIKKEHFCIFLTSIPALLLDHTVLWNLEFFCETFSLKFNNAEFTNVLKAVGLKNREAQKARTLSTGQKRRLSLACLLLIKPNIVLADEPTNGLDAEGIHLCLDIFSKLMLECKTSFLIATHDPNLINWCQSKISTHFYSPIKTNIRKPVMELL